MQDLAQMATFAEVVERGSFTAAAEALGMSKAFVSKQVAALEARLALVLLHRTTRRLRLTEEGERFHAYCRQMVDTAREGVRLMQSRSHQLAGRVRISAPITYGHELLAPRVLEFTRRFPEVQVDLVLENRKVDLAHEDYDVLVRISETPPEQYALTPLGVMEDVVCAAPAYLSRHGRPRQPADLRAHQCLLYLNPQRGQRWTFRRERRVEVVDVTGPLAVNHHVALLRLLEEGAGLSKLPEYCVQPLLAQGRLERVLADYQCDTLPIYLVHRELATQPARVREMVRFLAG